MYHAIVRRRSAAMFGHLSRGDWRTVVGHMTANVHHTFPGDHALGGERHSADAVAQWFGRLDRLFPRHVFTVERVVANGPPWNTWVAIRWSAVVVPQQGEPYVNHGSHWVHLRWARVDAFHASLDTERVAAAIRDLADAGVAEASAPPIIDEPDVRGRHSA